MTSKDLDAVFAWNVGHFVFIRADVKRWNDTIMPRLAHGELSTIIPKPGRLCIIGRHIEECHGGLQWYYAVRLGDKVCYFFEFELSATLET